jgi:hypothetical protein
LKKDISEKIVNSMKYLLMTFNTLWNMGEFLFIVCMIMLVIEFFMKADIYWDIQFLK